jgi:hypothetical protein
MHPKPPLWSILMETLKDKCLVNMADSLFEAKGGLRAAALVATNGPDVRQARRAARAQEGYAHDRCRR